MQHISLRLNTKLGIDVFSCKIIKNFRLYQRVLSESDFSVSLNYLDDDHELHHISAIIPHMISIDVKRDPSFYQEIDSSRSHKLFDLIDSSYFATYNDKITEHDIYKVYRSLWYKVKSTETHVSKTSVYFTMAALQKLQEINIDRFWEIIYHRLNNEDPRSLNDFVINSLEEIITVYNKIAADYKEEIRMKKRDQEENKKRDDELKKRQEAEIKKKKAMIEHHKKLVAEKKEQEHLDKERLNSVHIIPPIADIVPPSVSVVDLVAQKQLQESERVRKYEIALKLAQERKKAIAESKLPSISTVPIHIDRSIELQKKKLLAEQKRAQILQAKALASAKALELTAIEPSSSITTTSTATLIVSTSTSSESVGSVTVEVESAADRKRQEMRQAAEERRLKSLHEAQLKQKEKLLKLQEQKEQKESEPKSQTEQPSDKALEEKRLRNIKLIEEHKRKKMAEQERKARLESQALAEEKEREDALRSVERITKRRISVSSTPRSSVTQQQIDNIVASTNSNLKHLRHGNPTPVCTPRLQRPDLPINVTPKVQLIKREPSVDQDFSLTHIPSIASSIISLENIATSETSLDQLESNVPNFSDSHFRDFIPDTSDISIEPPQSDHPFTEFTSLAEPIDEPIAEPIAETIAEPIAEPIVESTVEAVEPVDVSLIENVPVSVNPVIEISTEPMIETIIQPITEPIDEPIVEQLDEPVKKTAIEPITEPDEDIDLEIEDESMEEVKPKKTTKTTKISKATTKTTKVTKPKTTVVKSPVKKTTRMKKTKATE